MFQKLILAVLKTLKQVFSLMMIDEWTLLMMFGSSENKQEVFQKLKNVTFHRVKLHVTFSSCLINFNTNKWLFQMLFFSSSKTFICSLCFISGSSKCSSNVETMSSNFVARALLFLLSHLQVLSLFFLKTGNTNKLCVSAWIFLADFQHC